MALIGIAMVISNIANPFVLPLAELIKGGSELAYFPE